MSLRQRILDLLASGPVTPREAAVELSVGFAYCRVRFSNLHTEKKIHVTTYRRCEENGRLYPRAVYALGPGKDAKPPGPLSDAEYNRRYRSAVRGQVNSVFALAGGVKSKRVALDWRGVTGG